MKIAIHPRDNSFSERWIEYCNKNNVDYKIVDCYKSNIVEQLNDCDGLMWHWDLNDYKASLIAKQITISLESKPIHLFPDYSTSWHYNDKVGQKYLFESLNIPMIPTYIFYSKIEALDWINTTTFPKVVKLRNGAGSLNVRLVRNKHEAKKVIKKSFSKGFASSNKIASLKDKILHFRNDQNLSKFIAILKSVLRFALHKEDEKYFSKEKGYVYVQDFIEGNEYDLRLVVVGNRCWAAARFNRDGDFRASGSGKVSFDNKYFSNSLIKLAFEITRKLDAQSIAYDFISSKGEYKLIEISYAYPIGKSDQHPGYWDNKLNWYEGNVNAEYFIIKDFINLIKNDSMDI